MSDQKYSEAEKRLMQDDFGKRLSVVKCPQCKELFKLTWDDWSNKPETLHIQDCPSGGIYNVKITCPFCNYEEEL